MTSLSSRLNGLARALPVWALWLLGALPFLWILWLTLTNGLGVNPVREIEHRLGKIALWFLLGGLAVTPLRRICGINLLRHRQALGLLAFTYILLHVAAWLWLDMGLLLGQALRDMVKRPYLVLGLTALLLLVPLALTSNRFSIRRLGRNWGRLHRLVYPACLLAVGHYLWQMKVVTGEGWLWLAALVALLSLRLGGLHPRKPPSLPLRDSL